MYLAAATPILYDFYNYDIEKPEFIQLFVKFTQVGNEHCCSYYHSEEVEIDLCLFNALVCFTLLIGLLLPSRI